MSADRHRFVIQHAIHEGAVFFNEARRGGGELGFRLGEDFETLAFEVHVERAFISADVQFEITASRVKFGEVPADVRAVADARWAARNAKDWPEADRLRSELTALGWTMKDGKDNYTLTRG